MEEERAGELLPLSAELVERGDIDGLTLHVGRLVVEREWDELEALRSACRLALGRGKQLWAVAAHVEYRLCLEAPAERAARMVEAGSGRFGLGPLAEVAASAHTWDELAPHLSATPAAALVAHERVVRGDDLSRDALASSLPEVLDLPLRLRPWEPAYVLAKYHPDRMEAYPPAVPLLNSAVGEGGRARGSRPRPAGRSRQATAGKRPPGIAPARRETPEVPHLGAAPRMDEVSVALEELVSAWTTESNGRAEAVSVRGDALDAVRALGAPAAELAELAPDAAVALMAWAAADGGAHGRRRGAASGRFGAWWVLAALGGLGARWPLAAQDLAPVLEDVRWYAWGSGEPVTGWALRLAIEAAAGPHRGEAWAVTAVDAV